jgi:serine/threonine-protein kinase
MSAATFAPQHEIVGRYRIVELLGVGRTAEVYRAEDRSLHRTVVVKVLLAELASHEDVRRAFRDNIVRAATLSHPHLARVYDGGQESGSIFVVSEYLSGGSLEDVLVSGRRFSPDDAARLGRDIASALAYLHANGIVHGALSPTKLLFDAEGRVRITDISLAGLADQYRGRPTLDQVRYFSPEQALGEPAVPASDVYALALILFEAATGTAAFDGLTTEAMAQARLGAPLPVRAELGTLDMLLAQAAIPDPLLRLSAEQFSARLNAVVKESAPLTVAPGNRAAPLLANFAPPEPRTSIGFRPSPDQIAGGTGPVPRVTSRPLISESAPLARARSRSRSRAPPRAGRPRHAQDFDEGPLPEEPRRRRVAFLVAAIVLVVAAVAAAAVWKSGVLDQPQTVPSLVSLDYQQAAQVIRNDGFTLRVGAHAYSSTVRVNAIVSQSPPPGTREKSGQVISVTVSDGPRLVVVPAGLLGEDCATASAQLQAAHLTGQCPSSDAVASATVPVGRVVRYHVGAVVNPTHVAVRSIVTLVLSSGAPATVTTTTTPPVATTTVPPVTTTTTATTTTTTVAGEGPRPVPNVAGMDQAQVFAAMRTAQLYFKTRGPHAGTSWTTAVSTQPPAGTSVPWHSTIIVNVR